ncbi:MAG: type II secretion system F family protein [Elusimicrobiota bacterium]
MKWLARMAVVLVFAVAALDVSSASFAQEVFSPADVKFIVGQKNGAELHMQEFYHYFKPDRDPALVTPAWIDRILPAMLKHPVWKDPEQGILNEADLWQAPVAVLYTFFETTRKTFPPSDGGELLSPTALISDYSDAHIRMEMSLDRLYRAHLDDSLEGRGRPLLADFRLIDKEMGALLDSLTSAPNPPVSVDLSPVSNGQTRSPVKTPREIRRYRTAVIAIAQLSNDAYGILHKPPRGFSAMGMDRHNQAVAGAMAAVLTSAGLMLVFLAGYFGIFLNERPIESWIANYKVKAKGWTREYERQFLLIKVNYLVGGPIVGGMLIGALTFNIWGFLIFTGFGVYGGLSLPGWLLRNLRFRRAIKCEKQLMDTIILMSNGLKSGIDLVQCLELVQKDMQPPISEEFGLCLKNYQLGTPLEKAMEGIYERVPSYLLAYLIKAVVIQRSVGGNLTKVFDRIVEIIREESKLVEKTAAMTAQQRIQAVVVGVMPWVMLFIMFVFQPGPMESFYFRPLGVGILLFCTVWIAIGMKIINKMGDIKI